MLELGWKRQNAEQRWGVMLVVGVASLCGVLGQPPEQLEPILWEELLSSRRWDHGH
jgi:hypothetical protein